MIVSQLFFHAVLVGIGLTNWHTVNTSKPSDKKLYDLIVKSEALNSIAKSASTGEESNSTTEIVKFIDKHKELLLLKPAKRIAFFLRTKTYNKDEVESFFAKGMEYYRSQYTPPQTINPLREGGYGIFYESTYDSIRDVIRGVFSKPYTPGVYFDKGGFWNGFIDGPNKAKTLLALFGSENVRVGLQKIEKKENGSYPQASYRDFLDTIFTCALHYKHNRYALVTKNEKQLSLYDYDENTSCHTLRAEGFSFKPIKKVAFCTGKILFLLARNGTMYKAVFDDNNKIDIFKQKGIKGVVDFAIDPLNPCNMILLRRKARLFGSNEHKDFSLWYCSIKTNKIAHIQDYPAQQWNNSSKYIPRPLKVYLYGDKINTLYRTLDGGGYPYLLEFKHENPKTSLYADTDKKTITPRKDA